MEFQELQGVLVQPVGNYNLTRFGKYLASGSFPTSSCFNAWIYSSNMEVGFSNKPTEIRLSLVLSTPNHAQQYSSFDILPSDLNCSAGNGGEENLWNFNFNGVNFSDFILHEYEISIEAGQKILNVLFKDYSIILDKVYCGLLQRQGNEFARTSIENVQYPVSCFNCYSSGAFVSTGNITRELTYASYVGIGGKTYDNFANVPFANGIYTQWSHLFNTQNTPLNPSFDLNGGYLILGNEEAPEELCGNVVPISYNFNELLTSLRLRGLNFIGAFPVAQTDRDFIYKQNYVGSLRTVLSQWCSDLSYDFFTSGKSFVGINLNTPIDISQITSIVDPTTTLGSQFSLNQNAVINSYKEKVTLDNTWRQGIVTTNNRAEDSKNTSRTTYRYVGILPMHPLDYNYPNNQSISRSDVFGNVYPDAKLANSFLQNNGNNPDIYRRCDRLDNRTFDDIDTCIALTKFNPQLRDIYCQQRLLQATGQSNLVDFNANCLALGFMPLAEITGASDKTFAIQGIVGNQNPEGNGDEISNQCLDQQFYRVFIGYYYQDFKDKVTQWESNAAENMYKYGAIKQGVLQGAPYIPYDVLQDNSPGAGLSGANGTQLIRITQKTNPACYQYFGWNYLPVEMSQNWGYPYSPNRASLVTAPFNDILLYSGIGSIYDPQLYIGELAMNDWGTSQEAFNRSLSLQINDACAAALATTPSYTNFALDGFDSKNNKVQDWRLEDFVPKATEDLQTFFEIYSDYFDMLSGQGVLDGIVRTYYNIQYQQQQTCSKLYIMVFTDTINHPNISVNFNKTDIQYVNNSVLRKYNEQMQNWIIQRELTPTLNVCEVPLLTQLCENVVYQDYLQFPGNPKFGCATENPYDLYLPGFAPAFVSNPNSRGLQISISKNPPQNNPSDIQNLYQGVDAQGDIYYSNILSNSFIPQTPQTANVTIIYPASIEGNSNNYYNCELTTITSINNRSPAINEVYGTPPNILNNNTVMNKVINNFITAPLQPQLDPNTNRFLQYMTVISGNNANIITTISGYATQLNNMYNYEATGAMKSIELSIAGTPQFFGKFISYINPIFGLQELGINVTDKGVMTSLKFGDRPKNLPKQESILNNVVSRMR